MPLEIPKDKWPGAIRAVTLGATAAEGGTRAHTVTIGGQTTLPFMHFEAPTPHRPVVAIEILSRRPEDWSKVLTDAWGEALADPAQWAKQAEAAGADLVVLSLSETDSAADAASAVQSVLKASGLPLIVLGPGQADKDNELLQAAAEAGKGERLLLGVCEDVNYRTIAANAIANGHLVIARTPMDVNLAKQLNILITDLGLPPESIVMDPTCGALGYGIEYGYSVMERLRLNALQGDSMTQMPMLVVVGPEAWKTKEARVGQGVPEAWGDWSRRAVEWETLTAVSLLEAGADIIAVRHPESLRRVKAAIDELMSRTD
jgi:acetyl-CoA decarbonylase/synthase complex subunit delta